MRRGMLDIGAARGDPIGREGRRHDVEMDRSRRRMFPRPAIYGAGEKCGGFRAGMRGAWPMTEDEWLSCTDPTPMLAFLQAGGRASDRKLRLFPISCVRS